MSSKIRLISLIAVFSLLLPLTALGVDKTIGYCSDSISDDVYPVGVSGQEIYLSAAVKFPTSMMQGLKGNKLTKIRFAIGKGMKNTRVWVRVGSLTSLPVLLQSVDETVEGWNEITLDTPYDIDGSDIYVGYSGKQPSDKLCVWLDGEENENATFINDGSWVDYYGYGWGALLIQAIVSGDHFATTDLAVGNISLDSTYYQSGSKAKTGFTISNQGINDIAGTISYSYQVDDNPPVSGTFEGTLSASKSVKISNSIDLDGLKEGNHRLRVFLNKSEAYSADEVAANDTASNELLVYTTRYKHNILLEQFTTIPCINCPNGNNTLNVGTTGRDDVVWTAHHVGFQTDELTISGSRDYLAFGVTGAPMAMFDRTSITGFRENPPVQIGYTSSTQGGAYVKAVLDYLAAIPSFSTVKVSCDYDENNRNLTVKVNGECNGIFQTLYPNTRLTMMLTENNVTAKAVQVGTTNDYTHNHVVRSILTDTFGDEILWDGDKFEYTKTVTLDESWKPSDMHAVAFISKPFVASEPYNAEVLNTGQGNVTGLSSIKAHEANSGDITIENGTLCVSGEPDAVEVYNANGTRVDVNGLKHGIYVVKVRKGNTVKTSKLIY